MSIVPEPHIIRAGQPLSLPLPSTKYRQSAAGVLRTQAASIEKLASGKIAKDFDSLRLLSDAARKSNYLAYLNFLRNIELENNERASRHKRRVAVRQGGEIFSGEQWLLLCDKHDNCCARCLKPSPLTIDHIQPVSKGGTNAIENIQPLCRSCNSHKGVQSTDYRK